jgi:hypothetical protein
MSTCRDGSDGFLGSSSSSCSGPWDSASASAITAACTMALAVSELQDGLRRGKSGGGNNPEDPRWTVSRGS